MHFIHVSADFVFLGMYTLSYADNTHQNLIEDESLAILFTGQQLVCHLSPLTSEHQI